MTYPPPCGENVLPSSNTEADAKPLNDKLPRMETDEYVGEDIPNRESVNGLLARICSRQGGEPSFHSIFLPKWGIQESTTRRISVSIRLSSTLVRQHHSLNWSPCSTVLDVHAIWPNLFAGSRLLKKYWLRRSEAGGEIKCYLPTILGLENNLKNYRKRKIPL